ncbi:MAG: Uma2 family endonuclease [Planctomyces sp.]|nr:Uma2 family endonuclease [Planctomyces sp.]
MRREFPMTAEEFVQHRDDLPEGGRWHELHSGRPVLLTEPDDQHGTIVLNLSRAIAEWLAAHRGQRSGYACHEVGLHVGRSPDTVYVPAISFFDSGPLFGQTDNIIATEVPRLVVDVASSNDRRRDMRDRTQAYFSLGVDMIWIPDPFKKEVQVLQRKSQTLALGTWQFLEGSAVLPGFRMEVRQVFAQPKWWTT